MIKAIAFDLIGVLIREKDVPLTEIEALLESRFGVINFDDDYYAWATKETGLDKAAIVALIARIANKRYEIREPDLFVHLPPLKFSTATNHVSAIDDWFRQQPIGRYFRYFVNSGRLGLAKPDLKFYRELLKVLGEQPEDILFVDDKLENIEGARAAGLSALHCTREMILGKGILEAIF